jgi:hypothetical protein
MSLKVGNSSVAVTVWTLAANGSLVAAPGDRLWWAIKLCRFAAGELDPYVQNLHRR